MMEMQTIRGDIRLKIQQDLDPVDPREWDNMGVMVCWHNRYNLGDSHNYDAPEDYEKDKDNLGVVIQLPLYLYDHSGLSMSTKRDYPFNCRWDSCQVGWIYITKKVLRDNLKVKKIGKTELAKAEDWLVREIDDYDKYLRGNIWGFMVDKRTICETCKHESWEGIESCWGFLGRDWENNGMADALGEYEDMLNDLEN